jgi:serine/threonine-protein kinase HipA
MGRRKTHVPLDVLINGRLVGQLVKAANGAISFQYDASWLAWEHRFPVSLSLPLRPNAYRGAEVIAVFDNLLPDRDSARSRVAARMGAQGTGAFSLLAAIGRDCVGAMQFLPQGEDAPSAEPLAGEPVSDLEIEAMLADLAQAPLGVNLEHEFRISVAGAQEKTALLRLNGQWLRPKGKTPTTHILKPQFSQIPTSDGPIDMSNSVDNEHYCMRLLAAFGLDVARTEIATFGQRRVLVVERFDRQWTHDHRLIRLPQEDCCQALGVPPNLKYQSDGGPNMRDILGLLRGADGAQADQLAFLKSQMVFWLIGATDGHAKNYSVFLGPGGGWKLTPFYDVLSAQLAFDRKQLQQKHFRLALSVGDNRHYRMMDIRGRHFVQTGRSAGIGLAAIQGAISDVLQRAPEAANLTAAIMPDDFSFDIHDSIANAMAQRVPVLAEALGA